MPEPSLPDVLTPTPAPVAWVETDFYCDRCGYNLRTQPVWRDPALGVLVCRCPECGAHRAAGLATIGSLWGRRLATALLLLWVALCVSGVATAALLATALQQESVGMTTYVQLESRDGVPLQQNNTQGNTVYLPTATAVTFVTTPTGNIKAVLPPSQTQIDLTDPPFVDPAEVVNRYRLREWITGEAPAGGANARWGPQWESMLIFAGVMAVLHAAFGLVMACVCWHWRTGRKWVWVLLPVAMLGVSLTLGRSSQRAWMTPVQYVNEHLVDRAMIGTAIFQTLAVAVGLWVGRPVMRLLVRLFVPRVGRPLLAFLWTADGKVPPRAVL